MSNDEERHVVARFRGLRGWWLLRTCDDLADARRFVARMGKDRRNRVRIVTREQWRRWNGKAPLDVGGDG